MRSRSRTLLILSVLVASISVIANAWVWSEYAIYIDRLTIAPIPVPSPP